MQFPLQSVALLARGPPAVSARRTHVQLLPAKYPPRCRIRTGADLPLLAKVNSAIGHGTALGQPG
jgi:hypothetical protein